MRTTRLSLMLGLILPLSAAALAAPPAERGGAGRDAAPSAERAPGAPGRGGQGAGGPMRLVGDYRQAIMSLDLSADQRAQMREIFSGLPARVRELAEQTQDMDRPERAERFRELLQEVQGQVNEHLSADQQAQLQDKMAEIREQRAQERADRDPQDPNAPAAPPPPGGPQRRGNRGGEGQAAPAPGNPDQAPRGPRAGGPGEGRGAMVDRFAEAVTSLDGLSAEQKSQLEPILAEAREKLAEVRRNAAGGGDRQAAMEEAREVFASTREQVIQILTPDQRQQLRESLRPGDGQPGAPGNADRPGRERRGDGEPRPDRPRRSDAAPPPAGDGGMGGGMMPAEPPPPPPEAPAAPDQPTTKPTANAVGRSLLAAGTPAPAFALSTTAGKQVALSSLKTRPTVLIFGSYSSPSFRDSAKAINALARRLDGRANVYVVYTREAHPAGEWDVQRNRDAGVSVPRHASAADRLAAAKQAVKSLELQAPVLVDTMDDATLTAYGEHPNGAVVIARDGTIAASLKHFDRHAVRRAVDELK